MRKHNVVSNIDKDEYINLKEISELMGVTPRTIDHYRKADVSKRLGRPKFPEFVLVEQSTRVRYWKKEEVLSWLEETDFKRRNENMSSKEPLERDFMVPVWPLPKSGFLVI